MTSATNAEGRLKSILRGTPVGSATMTPATPVVSNTMTKRQKVYAWSVRSLLRSKRWHEEQSLRRQLRREQINLYLAELNMTHAQKAVAEMRHEVVRLKELQSDKGFTPEHEYAPFKTWIVRARDITTMVNVILSLCTALILIAAAAFYRGMLP